MLTVCIRRLERLHPLSSIETITENHLSIKHATMKLLSVFISLIIATTAIQNQFLQARNADSNGVKSEGQAASLGCIKRGSNTICRRNNECCSGSLCLNGRCRKPSGPIKTPPGVVEHESADDIEGVNSNDIEARLEVVCIDLHVFILEVISESDFK
ncbi:Protein of unknown function [Pyronema omphalodes CBS 100304]|uniref:Uncharacterized protein n=1 Tax=Pyronema omphalodes (strain CBS 100304) TaxID=1076935 RepID=U4LDC7_PYROM|nr:Protein of unknown function [Pyronema omphalodes CBS 100304]